MSFSVGSDLEGSRVQPLLAHLRGYPISACGLTDFAGKDWDLNLVRDAQAHFERSRAIDPSNVVAEAFLSQLHGTTQAPRDRQSPDSDDEKMNVDEPTQARKRTRT
ncbi:hypothetical protein GSI_00983 [Ganoderma sinense ZZ0214-1]|uniref:Uncharacterized protein n=1 Tax=Ganoderma sinense ZZ0214-1 TaxID=1077348 RepID=A0A2G8SU52_9APHY|nr:hypothetical protein GSI_00983 [Ganoderma sinense ZZ0214-1]